MTNHGDLDTNRKQRPGDSRVRRVANVLDSFERAIVLVLIALMSLVVLFASIDLAWTIVRDMLAPPFLLMTLEGLLDTFGAFLLVLIGLELLETGPQVEVARGEALVEGAALEAEAGLDHDSSRSSRFCSRSA